MRCWRVCAVLLVLWGCGAEPPGLPQPLESGRVVSVEPPAPPQPPESSRVVHAERTAFGPIFVVDEGPLRVLRFGRADGDDQSAVSLNDPTRIHDEYIRLAVGGLAHLRTPESVLMIGLGAGIYTTLLWRALPELQIDAVEINPAVARVAREYFGLPDSPRYRVHIADGLEFVEESDRQYDLIFVDAYTGDDLPSHLVTETFFASLRSRLGAGGGVILNLAVSYAREETSVAAFSAVFALPVCYRGSVSDNLVVVGTQEVSRAPPQIQERARQLQAEMGLRFDLVEHLKQRCVCPCVP